ncbi:MAG TPA: FAD-dependent monooxygenase, partial [Homoserinimonas sp.]|nr:FAD-dependent monooxygenase [Homoserinimonas sp.]
MSDTAVHADQEIPVLIVGGSLVGLTTSLLLSNYGIPNLVVEKHRGTAIHPRAASFHQRTMEVFRHAGVQDVIEEAAAKEFVQNGAIVAVESLCGKELQYFYKSWNEGVEDLSATSRLFITQVGLEPVLREAAGDRGASHAFGTELVSLEQD